MTPCVFFDMDGVLIDSEPVWEEAMDRVFGELDIRLDAALKARTAGMGNEESVRLVLSQYPRVGADVSAICSRIDDVVLDGIASGVGDMPGADGLLRELAGRGVPLALVSTSAPALIQAVVQANGWGDLFRLTLSSEDVGPGPRSGRSCDSLVSPDVEGIEGTPAP
jgi:sugar-phosphatase